MAMKRVSLPFALLAVLAVALLFGCSVGVTPQSAYSGSLQKMRNVKNLNISYTVNSISAESNHAFDSSMSVRQYVRGDKLRMDLEIRGFGPAESVPIRIYSNSDGAFICSKENIWRCYAFNETGLADLASPLSLGIAGRIASDEGFASNEFLSFTGVEQKYVKGRNCQEVTMALASMNSSWAGAGGIAIKNATIISCFDDQYGVVLKNDIYAEASGGLMVITSTFEELDAETEIPDYYFTLPE